MELFGSDAWEDDDNTTVENASGQMCELCHGGVATWELSQLGARQLIVCEPCAQRELGGYSHPLEAMRAYLSKLPWQERSRIALSVANEARAEALAIRAGALNEGHRDGNSWAEVGRAAGITPQRAANIASGRDQRRREAERRNRIFGQHH